MYVLIHHSICCPLCGQHIYRDWLECVEFMMIWFHVHTEWDETRKSCLQEAASFKVRNSELIEMCIQLDNWTNFITFRILLNILVIRIRYFQTYYTITIYLVHNTSTWNQQYSNNALYRNAYFIIELKGIVRIFTTFFKCVEYLIFGDIVTCKYLYCCFYIVYVHLNTQIYLQTYTISTAWCIN